MEQENISNLPDPELVEAVARADGVNVTPGNKVVVYSRGEEILMTIEQFEAALAAKRGEK